MPDLSPRLEVLPQAQRLLWPALQPAADLGFALYGGTAIALRLGHRTSIDFDFFSSDALDRNALFAAMPFLETGRASSFGEAGDCNGAGMRGVLMGKPASKTACTLRFCPSSARMMEALVYQCVYPSCALEGSERLRA
jgi:hypothetical protein